ncbi:hypothetical protein OEA41_006276 [Lepraria neglecta]|uniref:Uncharacterized protein n=1 Tax=Lepraria neglecta TaxID=209136 RepID=A0AAD9Z7P4_9LECA|nr:hypothetical protein OEA41_006276 [Lepraria neglecta]
MPTLHSLIRDSTETDQEKRCKKEVRSSSGQAHPASMDTLDEFLRVCRARDLATKCRPLASGKQQSLVDNSEVDSPARDWGTTSSQDDSCAGGILEPSARVNVAKDAFDTSVSNRPIHDESDLGVCNTALSAEGVLSILVPDDASGRRGCSLPKATEPVVSGSENDAMDEVSR